ncbi:MAG: hypothetical protein QOD55_1486 [Solirubrobacteraceae bacterium]|jgi:hypothetical protein|nr:hypothetical protein [Solirubrobacteraceae bacterium]
MRIRVLVPIAAVALVVVLAAPAPAQQSPTLGAPSTSETPAPVQPATTSASDGGLATWQEALIFGAGLLLIGGIAFAILGDARERAARLGGRSTEPADAPHRHRQHNKQRARAKAKAAKAQRRRNR